MKMKSDEAKQVLQSWVDQQKHGRCWYYPDIFNRLCEIFEVTPTNEPNLPSRIQFEIGCKYFQDEQYGNTPLIELGSHDKPVVSGTQFTLTQLLKELAALGTPLETICEIHGVSVNKMQTSLYQLADLLDK